MAEKQDWATTILHTRTGQGTVRSDVGLPDLQHSTVDSPAVEAANGVIRDLDSTDFHRGEMNTHFKRWEFHFSGTKTVSQRADQIFEADLPMSFSVMLILSRLLTPGPILCRSFGARDSLGVTLIYHHQ